MRFLLVPLAVAAALSAPSAPVTPLCTKEVPAWAVALTEDTQGRRLKCSGAVVEIPAVQPDREHCRLVIATANHCFKQVTTAWVGTSSIQTRTTNLVRFTEVKEKDLAYFEISVGRKCSEFEAIPVEPGATGSTFEYFDKNKDTFCTTPYRTDTQATFNNSGGALRSTAKGLVGVLSGDNGGVLKFARGTLFLPVEDLVACRGLDATACSRKVNPPGFKIGTTRVVHERP